MCGKQEHLKQCFLTCQQSLHYLMTLTSVVNVISMLPVCLVKAVLACLEVNQGPEYSSCLNSVQQTTADI